LIGTNTSTSGKLQVINSNRRPTKQASLFKRAVPKQPFMLNQAPVLVDFSAPTPDRQSSLVLVMLVLVLQFLPLACIL
jgi:hypothetical protein